MNGQTIAVECRFILRLQNSTASLAIQFSPCICLIVISALLLLRVCKYSTTLYNFLFSFFLSPFLLLLFFCNLTAAHFLLPTFGETPFQMSLCGGKHRDFALISEAFHLYDLPGASSFAHEVRELSGVSELMNDA